MASVSWEQQGPWVRVTFDGPISEDEFSDYLAWQTQNVGQNTRRVVLIDARKAAPTSASQRKKMADWQKLHAATMRRNTAGLAFVIDKAIIRGALTAIFWMSPLPCPHRIFATVPEAEAWLRDQLDRMAQPSQPAR